MACRGNVGLLPCLDAGCVGYIGLESAAGETHGLTAASAFGLGSGGTLAVTLPRCEGFCSRWVLFCCHRSGGFGIIRAWKRKL